MLTLSPFKGLIPDSSTVHQISAPPYDVVDRKEALEIAKGNPMSFLRVSRSEIEFPENIDPYSDPIYEKARENFARLREEAPLKFDDSDSFYVYSISMNGHRQSGLVAALSVDDYDQNRVKKHELTRKAKEDDRTHHTLSLRAHTGPVFLTYRSTEKIIKLTEKVMGNAPLLKVEAPNGSVHQVWRVPQSTNSEIISLFKKVPCLYVADGHHRAKSASRVRQVCKTANPQHSGNEAYNRFLSVIFPDDQLNILAYNRVIRDLNSHSTNDFLQKIKSGFKVKETNDKTPSMKGYFHMYLEHQWYEITLESPDPEASVTDRLDVSILQQKLLQPILGIGDPRTDNRIDFIGGIHGPEKLEHLVDNGEAAVAFSLYPVTVDELMDISDNGMIMPPKSTWFEPKLRDGLVCHCF